MSIMSADREFALYHLLCGGSGCFVTLGAGAVTLEGDTALTSGVPLAAEVMGGSGGHLHSLWTPGHNTSQIIITCYIMMRS